MWLRVCSNDHAPLSVMPYIFFKIKNCLNDDLFISCNDNFEKVLHNICISAVAMSLRWATRGPWASFFFFFFFFFAEAYPHPGGHQKSVQLPCSIVTSEKSWPSRDSTNHRKRAEKELFSSCLLAQKMADYANKVYCKDCKEMLVWNLDNL